ncbi:MAG: hypothetical protein U1F16_09470 [Turneriella sp.]
MEITANISTLGNMKAAQPQGGGRFVSFGDCGLRGRNTGHNNTLQVTSGHAVHYDWTYSNFGNP